MTSSSITTKSEIVNGERFIGGVPVRNIWLLMLYASRLFKEVFKKYDAKKGSVEENPDDIPDLIAEILAHHVQIRIKRNLNYEYQHQNANLRFVRGNIDFLYTERHQLLEQGKIACRYEEFTIDSNRNRYVRTALEKISKLVKSAELVHRCRSLAMSLRKMGVVGECPDRSAISIDRIGRHQAEDRFMLSAARLAFDLMLPTEESGSRDLTMPKKDPGWIRKLYEKGIAGFYQVVLSENGWHVYPGKRIGWNIEAQTAGIDTILPSMVTDIILDHSQSNRRIIVDTKFNSILTKGWYRKESLRSGYLFQIYAYLRSQEVKDNDHSNSLANCASGLLLHPSIKEMIDESVVIQGHEIRFVTVNLGGSAKEIRNQLINGVRDKRFPLDE